ncbi:MAG: SDR family NAD(P)-dependent oxidoreductase [Myxococcota bacterium]
MAGVDLTGRVVVVTGSNTGIGFEAARAFAAGGATVELACRDATRGKQAAERIRSAHRDAVVGVGELDLGSLASVRAYCESFVHVQCDILLCNAGLVVNRYEQTEDGFERTLGVSHLGHFALFCGLLERMLVPERSRLVVVSSESHRTPKTLDFENFPLPAAKFGMIKAYGQAKLCNALFASEVARRYADQGITAVSLHPGSLIPTEISRGSRLSRILMALASPLTKSIAQGAATSVYCATAPEVEAQSGQYFSDCVPKTASREARDPKVAERLWTATADLIGAA